MKGNLRPLHVLVLVAAGSGAFVIARELASDQPSAAIAEAAERPSVARAQATERTEVPTRAPDASHGGATEADATAASSGPRGLDAPRPAFGKEASADPFRRTAPAAPPAPPPPPPAPPPAPKAPPVPFTFVGLVAMGTAQPAAFLARGEELLVASAGDVIDQNYRVESLTSSEIVLTYLPLKQRQAITLAGGER